MMPSDHCNPYLAQHHAAMDRLMETPRYWRGQAGTARRCAEEAHQRGDWRTADHLHTRALWYEARAEALTLRAAQPDEPPGHRSESVRPPRS